MDENVRNEESAHMLWVSYSDRHVYPHEDPFTPQNRVKWLWGKWIWAREDINSLLEILFMLSPMLNFPHLSHFQFIKEKNVGVWDISGQSGSCMGLSSSFCVKSHGWCEHLLGSWAVRKEPKPCCIWIRKHQMLFKTSWNPSLTVERHCLTN